MNFLYQSNKKHLRSEGNLLMGLYHSARQPTGKFQVPIRQGTDKCARGRIPASRRVIPNLSDPSADGRINFNYQISMTKTSCKKM
jgi:hypothetical protein